MSIILLANSSGTFMVRLLNRLAFYAVDFLVYHLRLAYLKFVALAAHGLDEHREVEHTAPADYPLVGGVAEGSHAQGEVFLQFLLQAVVDVAAGDVFSLLAEEWRVVDCEQHAHRRLVNRDGGSGSGFSKSQMVSPISNFSKPMIAQMSPLETLGVFTCPMPSKVCRLLYFGLLLRAVAVADGNVHALGERAAVYATNGYSAGVA